MHGDVNRSPSSAEQVGAALAGDYLYASNAPTLQVDPLGLWTVFGGPNGEVTGGYGATAGVGSFASSSGRCTRVGGFGSVGATLGWNGGAGWNFGFAVADARGREQFFGPSLVHEWSFFGANMQLFFSPKGRLFGAALGVGLPISGVGIFGSSVHYSFTSAVGSVSFGGPKPGGGC
jgi:hypothetical protein